MAVIRTIQANRGIDVGGIPSTRVDDSVGQGLRSVGADVAQAGEIMQHMELRRERMRMEMAEFRSDQEFRRFGDDFSLDFAKTQQNIDPSGDGFTENVSTEFNKKAEAFLKTVPDALKPKFTELVKTSREEWINRAAATEIDQRNTWYREGITKAQQGLQTQVFNDPALFDAAKADGARAIEASGLPPAEKQKLKEAWEETLALTIGEREVRDAEANPTSAAGAADRLGVRGVNGAVDQVVDRIIGVESGGNPNAKNPNSSASGAGQFIDSTWLAMVRKYRPDIAVGRSAGEIIALKTDYGLSREMTKAYTVENATFLGNRGLEATPGNIYLAHFLGPRGAVQVLKANPSASVESIVGGDVVRANSFLAGKSASQLVAWAEKKMGGKGGPTEPAAPDPRYAALPLAKRLEIYDNVTAAAKRGQTAIEATVKAQYDAHKGSLDLGIQTGKISSAQTILNDTVLTDAHKADLLSALRARQGENAGVSTLIAALASEDSVGAQLNAFDADDRKLGNKAHETILKATPPEMHQAVTESFVAGTGYIPEKATAGVRQSLHSTNAQDVGAGLEQAERLYQIAPSAFDAVESGKEMKDAALFYREMVHGRGLSKDQAAQRYAELHSPEMVERRERLKKPAEDFGKTLAVSDVTGAFDTLTSWEPTAGLTPDQEAAVLADYVEIAREKFLETGGDAELAKTLALQEIAGDGTRPGLYGVSKVSGSGVVMKFPPERYYPPVAGGHDYIREIATADAKDFAKAMGEGEPSNVMLRVSPKETTDDVRAGRPPRYELWYQNDAGVWNRANGLFVVPQNELQSRMKANSAERLQQAEERRRTLLENRARQGDANDAARGELMDPTRPDWLKAMRANTAREQRLMQPTPTETRADEARRQKAGEIRQQRDELLDNPTGSTFLAVP